MKWRLFNTAIFDMKEERERERQKERENAANQKYVHGSYEH